MEAVKPAPTITIGRCYVHKLHGECVVVLKNRNGYWIQVWDGRSGDRLHTFKGIRAADLSPSRKLLECRECLGEFEQLTDGLCEDCHDIYATHG